MADLQQELLQRGYLSLVKFTKYLKQYEPAAYISYPTALKLVQNGNIQAFRVGNNYRITRVEVKRWVEEGNWLKQFTKPIQQDDPFNS